MMLARHNRIGSVKPVFSVRWATATNIRHVSMRATILSKYPELNDQTARKRILERYIDRYANLGLNWQNAELRKARLLGVKLEQFVRLRSEAIAARLLEDNTSGKLSRQYKECEEWLKITTPEAKKLYEAERDAVLRQFPKLELALMRENILKQYEMGCKRILLPSNEGDPADQPNVFVSGTTHEEKRHLCHLALQYVAIHLIENPMTSREALGQWRADF
jgi:hypothetical protein